METTNSTFGFKPSGNLQKSLRKMKAAEKAREERSAKLRDEYLQRVNQSKTRSESEGIVIDAAREKEMLESDFLSVFRAHSIKWIVTLKANLINQPTKENHGN